MDEIKNTPDSEAVQPSTPQASTPQPETAGQRLPAFLAALLAIVAWVVLLFSDGYLAIIIGLVAAAVGFYAVRKGWRSLATAAIIAALVLVVVTVAFLVVINFVL